MKFLKLRSDYSKVAGHRLMYKNQHSPMQNTDERSHRRTKWTERYSMFKDKKNQCNQDVSSS